MALDRRWTTHLVDASGTTLEMLGEFKTAKGRSYTKTLNAPGSASVTVSMSEPLTAEIVPLNTGIAFARNGIVKWAGRIIQMDEDFVSGQVQLQATGWLDDLNKRLIRNTDITGADDLNYPGDSSGNPVTDAGDIAFDLLDLANNQGLRPTGITKGGRQFTQKRIRSYQRFTSIGAAINELSQIEAGFDYEVDPWTRVMKIWAQLGTDRTDQVVLGYNAGPGNVNSFRRSTSAASLVTRMNGICRSTTEIVEDEAGSGTAPSPPAIVYGLYEEAVDLGTVSPDIARAYAAAEVAVRGLPLSTFEVGLLPYLTGSSVPSFDASASAGLNFVVGDFVTLVAQRDYALVGPLGVRVMSATMTIDDNDVERVSSLTLTPAVRTADSFTKISKSSVLESPYSWWKIGDATYGKLGSTTRLG